MIFITGDTHRNMDIGKLDEKRFPEQKLLTRNDYLIIAGDFGGIWTGDDRDYDILTYHNEKNYTTLFIGGNHENHAALNKFPVTEWNGGKIHRICDNVIHLMNGQVFTIEGKKIFTMGGATSVDKMFRKEGESWWPEEEPSEEEFKEGFENLARAKNEVDYIVTHTVPEKVRMMIYELYSNYIVDCDSPVERYLDLVMENIVYKKWFCGHVHTDREFTDYKLRILYEGIVKI